MTAYIWPLPASIAPGQLFGQSPGGYNPAGGHTGIDFPCPVGTPVRAVADGVIEVASELGNDNGSDNEWWLTSGGGLKIVLDAGAGAPDFVYAHLSQVRVQVGQRVKQGDIIGLSGNSGKWTTGPHLHFEAMPPNWNFYNGTYGRVNPGIYCTGYYAYVAPAASVGSTQRVTGEVGVKYRKAPTTSAEIIETFPGDVVLDFKGYVTNGQSVDGNSVWFVGAHTGGFAWSGGFTNKGTAGLPDLTPKPVEAPKPTPAPSASVSASQRITGPSGAKYRKAPSTSAEIINTFPGDVVLDFKGYVTNGTNVDGNSVWFVGAHTGGFAWSGGFTNKGTAGLPDLTSKAPAPSPATPAPTTPSKPVTEPPAPSKPVVFKAELACIDEVVPAHPDNYEVGNFPAKPTHIVTHQQGEKGVANQENTTIWFSMGQEARNGAGPSSTHFSVGKNGHKIQHVELKNRAYHSKAAGNAYWAVELPPEQTPESIAAAQEIIRELNDLVGYELIPILHRDIPTNATECGKDIDIRNYQNLGFTKPVTPSKPAPVESSTKEKILKEIQDVIDLVEKGI